MTRGISKSAGEGECQYRYCDLPGKKFKKKKDNQEYCCSKHRTAEWNLNNPRTKSERDLKAQVPIGLEILPLPTMHVKIDKKEKGNGKRWHYPNWQTNERLQKTLTILRSSTPTNHEIIAFTGTTRPKDDCIELRAQGFDIKSVPAGKSEDGKRRINRWVLTENKP